MALTVTNFISDTYSAQTVRRMMASLPMQPGVVATMNDPDPLMPSKTGAEAAPMGFTIGAGAAWVRSTANNGWYHVVNQGAYEFLVDHSHLSTSQDSFDLICIEVEDATDLGDVQDRAFFRQVTGTGGSSRSFSTNPIETQGFPAVGDNQCAIAAVLNPGPSPVPGSIPQITNTSIRDVRSFARGFRFHTDWTGGDFVLATAGSFQRFDFGLGTRVCPQSSLIRCRLQGSMAMAASVYNVIFGLKVSHHYAASSNPREYSVGTTIATARDRLLDIEWFIPVTAGVSVYVEPMWKLSSAVSTTVRANASYPLTFEIEEIWQPERGNS